MRLRRISIRPYRATLLQGSTHVGLEEQVDAKHQHKSFHLMALLLERSTLVRLAKCITHTGEGDVLERGQMRPDYRPPTTDYETDSLMARLAEALPTDALPV